MFEQVSIIGCGLIGSSILRNINGEFTDVSEQVFGDNPPKGIIKDAVWVDLNNDKIINLQN